MSSNIESSKHFNSIESKLIDIFITKTGSKLPSFPYALKKDFPWLYNGSDAFNAKREILNVIDDLRKINVLAVMLQYKHHYEGKLDEKIKSQTEILFADKTSKKDLSMVGLFKALDCLSYQIEQEHIEELRHLTIDEQKALNFLEVITNTISHNICRNIEDKTNNWSIE
jgi:hypothetical protein